MYLVIGSVLLKSLLTLTFNLLLFFPGVYGKVQIYSAYPKTSWTHLGINVAPGNERWYFAQIFLQILSLGTCSYDLY